MNPTNDEVNLLSRRQALKALLVAGGAAGLSALPERWEPPLIEVGTLPAFAQTSPQPRFEVILVRQLTACENQSRHHIFTRVIDGAGQGLDGIPLKIEWAPVPDGHVIAVTETQENWRGAVEPGWASFAMFKGSYTVQVAAGPGEIAGPVTPNYGTNEACGENAVANSPYHLSFEIIFRREL